MTTSRPVPGPTAPWAFPTPRRTVLDSGLQVLSYDVPGQYVTSVRLAVPLTLRDEPLDREGVATLMARTLDEGTERHTASQMAVLLERSGAALGAGVGENGLAVDVDVPVHRLPAALDLLRQCLDEPAFPAHEVQRHTQARLAEIEQERSVPARRAAWQLARTLYDPADRASRPAAGRSETIAAISRDDVAAFHAAHVRAAGATLVLAGDLPSDTLALVEQTLGGWAGAPQGLAAAPPDPAYAVDRRRIVVVDRPGSVQAELVVAAPGPDRRVPGGWAPYPVLGFLVGGSPSARIDTVLREEKGYTYGIRSGFRPRHRGGVFVTSGSVRADATVDAVDVLLRLLESGRHGFTDAEVRRGIDYVAKTAPARFATADAVADEAATMALDALTTDFTTAMLADLPSLTADRLTQAYADVVDGSWTVVIVADAEQVVDGLRGLGRGQVDVVPA